MRTRVALVTFLAVASAITSARAQTTADTTSSGTTEPSSSASSAIDIGTRPDPGQAIFLRKVATSADVGVVARPPATFAGQEKPVIIAGGDVGLASWLTLRLYGFQDASPAGSSFSGMSAGIQAWLLPKNSPIQIAAAGGYMETSTPGAPAVWGQVSVLAQTGLFQAGASVRATSQLGAPSNVPAMTSVIAMSYGSTIKVGVAYVVESGVGTAPPRQAIVPSVTATTKSGVTFGASSTLGLTPGSGATVPLMLRVGGRF